MTDLFQPQGPDETGEEPRPLGHQLLWFGGLAIVGLIVVAASAYLLRSLLLIG